MEINFCRRCGSHLADKGDGAYLCERGHHVYYKSYPAAGVLLLNSKNEVLLSERGIEPNKGMFDLPGGFCNVAETRLDAAMRELEEELGLTANDYEPLQYLSEAIDMYPYEGEVLPNTHAVFWARIKQDDVAVQAKDDVASFTWVPITDVDFSKISKDATSDRLALKTMQRRLAA